MQLKYAKQPRWANAEQTQIDLLICWEEWDRELPFTATKNDPEEHGQQIYSMAIAGIYGTIEEYIPPIPLTIEVQAIEVRKERNARISSTDWTQASDIPETLKSKWAGYRQALRDIPTQVSFPTIIEWPPLPT